MVCFTLVHVCTKDLYVATILRELHPISLLCYFADYVEEIYQTFLNASKDDLRDATTKLKERTPAPMNTMLEKQPREEAIQKRVERKKMTAKDVPPTTPVSQVPEETSRQGKGKRCKQSKETSKGKGRRQQGIKSTKGKANRKPAMSRESSKGSRGKNTPSIKGKQKRKKK